MHFKFFRKENILCTPHIRENENLNQYVIHGRRKAGVLVTLEETERSD